MKIDGGCHCGKITYEAEIDPAEVLICHCTDCQHISGSAFRVVVGAKEGTFRLITGEPRTYIKTAESSRKRAMVFCADCGTHLYAASPDGGPAFFGLRVGTIRQRAELRPSAQYWCDSALDWARDIGGLSTTGKQ